MNHRILYLITYNLYIFSRLKYSFIDSLKLISKSLGNTKLKKTMENFSTDLQKGNSIEYSLNKYKNIFPEFFMFFLISGYKNNTLKETLEFLKDYYYKINKIKNKTTSLFYYIYFVSVLSLLAIGVLIFYILPEFISFFDSTNLKLPAEMRATIVIIEFLKKYSFFILLISLFLIFSIIFFYRNFLNFKIKIDRIFLKFYFSKKIIKEKNCFLFCKLLYYQNKQKMDLISSLKNIIPVLTNSAIQQEVYFIIGEIQKGKSFSEAIKKNSFLPQDFKAIVKISEKTGELSENLKELAIHYEKKLFRSLDIAISLIEPALICGVGGAVLFIMFLIYNTMFNIVNMIAE